MRSNHHAWLLQIFQFVVVGLLLMWPAAAGAQTVVATVPIGAGVPEAVAVNPVTNKIYVASCTYHPYGQSSCNLTVIDGATNATTAIPFTKGFWAADVAVNPMTNKIYVPGGVIDGATNSVTYLTAAEGNAVAVNPVTNKIYVANAGGYTYVIDGDTDSITTVIDPNASSLNAGAIAVNTATNKIYVTNNSIPPAVGSNPGNVTVIDGATNSTTTLTDASAFSPLSVAVNPITNKIYVANQGDYPAANHGNITVIDGATNAITTLTDPSAVAPRAVAVDQNINKIYVPNGNDSSLTGSGGVTVIDGATNTISSVTDPNAIYPQALAVNSTTNTIYVTNQGNNQQNVNPCCNPGSVTVINGATNAVAAVIDPNSAQPGPVVINPTTNMIYVANLSGNVTVIDGGTAPTSHLLWVHLAGSQSGTVTSTPAGVNCGTSCTASFATGTAVNLTASPAPGTTFSGWSGACTGAGACNLTLNSDDFVMAAFFTSGDFSVELASPDLTVQPGGQVTDVITIARLNASFSGVVQLNCSMNGPLSCALSPSSVTPGANPATATLTVTGPPQSAELIPPILRLAGPLYAVFLPVTLGLIGFGWAPGKLKQRRHRLWLLCSLFITFVVLQAGCGGGGGPSNCGLCSVQSYTVTITGTSSGTQSTAQVTVAVPQ